MVLLTAHTAGTNSLEDGLFGMNPQSCLTCSKESIFLSKRTSVFLTVKWFSLEWWCPEIPHYSNSTLRIKASTIKLMLMNQVLLESQKLIFIPNPFHWLIILWKEAEKETESAHYTHLTGEAVWKCPLNLSVCPPCAEERKQALPTMENKLDFFFFEMANIMWLGWWTFLSERGKVR